METQQKMVLVEKKPTPRPDLSHSRRREPSDPAPSTSSDGAPPPLHQHTPRHTAGRSWVKAETAAGKPYYWDSETREARWDRPPSARKPAVPPLQLSAIDDTWKSPLVGSGRQEPLPPVSAPPRVFGNQALLEIVGPSPRLPYLSKRYKKKSKDEPTGADDDEGAAVAHGDGSGAAAAAPAAASESPGTESSAVDALRRAKLRMSASNLLAGAAGNRRVSARSVASRVELKPGSFDIAQELQRRRLAAAHAVGFDMEEDSGTKAKAAKAKADAEAAAAKEKEREKRARRKAAAERRAKQRESANAGGMFPLPVELEERMDALRDDSPQRRQLARRLKPDTTLLKAQLVKQMGAVQDSEPERRHELLQQRAQQRNEERAEVAARHAALLPKPPELPRGGDGARTPRANAAHLARYRHEPEMWHGDSEGETHRQRARSLAGDISRMLR